jgi:cyclophilin family peptidyl-prolyl cis-trans isomerase
VEIEMMDGARVALRLLPFEAPTNAARFARLARRGYFDGLTFHRVVPNFVVQGGSPHANEYTGDGPFSRDELGLAGNWRGTVGLSTRGRDTGDAQIFFNLVDNVRLDHDYTFFAVVVEGVEAVGRVLEGARIRSVRVRRVLSGDLGSAPGLRIPARPA